MEKVNYKTWSWLILFSRLVFFFSIQALLALCFSLLGKNQPWESSANWWPFIVAITNILCILLLGGIYRKEERPYWSIFKFEKGSIGKDVLTVLGILLVAAPISYLPNIMLAKAIFGDPQITLDLLLRPLPYWAAILAIIVFPITQGLAEIPVYFSYVMPQLEKHGLAKWLALGIPALLLSFQHIAVPFLFNIDFMIWRALMFLPFALLLGIVMNWRPRLLPYLAIVHALMDMSFAAMLLMKAY